MKQRGSTPYQSIAAFYDELMSHVDYPMWADYVREAWFRHADGLYHSIHDAACGTGRFLECMREDNVARGGSDSSVAMLEIARRRLDGQGVTLDRCDLRELSLAEPCSLVTCLYDSVNYLLDTAALTVALKRLAVLTRPEGLIVFDICTERNSLDHFLDYSDEGVAGHWDFKRHSWYDRDTRLHHNTFDVCDLRDNSRFREHHRQRIFRVKEVEGCIMSAGLDLLGCYRGFSFERGSERADRVHFVARPGARHG